MIDGVRLRALEPHHDDRGTFTELHRLEWGTGIEPVQWNAVRSAAGVLRGVHVHRRHADYLTVVAGRALIALCDLRGGRAGAAQVLELDAERPQGLTIPPGVAHGFFFPEPSMHVYAVSHAWDPADELGCRWDDPGLGLDWEPGDPRISPRDRDLPTLDALLRLL